MKDGPRGWGCAVAAAGVLILAHMVTLKSVEADAMEAGFSFEVRDGPAFGFFARFRRET